ncbi:MAG TPA: hypothetical protein VMR95_01300 [Candidatus Binatia bacterium]|nr:hypothetical protein [Candidatus Binatia bacterium]
MPEALDPNQANRTQPAVDQQLELSVDPQTPGVGAPSQTDPEASREATLAAISAARSMIDSIPPREPRDDVDKTVLTASETKAQGRFSRKNGRY